MPSAADPDEDQTDHRENQKVRKVLEKDQMFDLPHLEVERKVRGEILQTRFSMQKPLEEERASLCFEQKARCEKLADLLQNHPSRCSNLADRLLEQKPRDPIVQGLEEEQEDLLSNQTEPFLEPLGQGVDPHGPFTRTHGPFLDPNGTFTHAEGIFPSRPGPFTKPTDQRASLGCRFVENQRALRHATPGGYGR
jgi:hypothetical protein